MDNPQKIEDIDGPLLADLRNKLGPVWNLLAMLKICDGITHPLILKEIEESKEVIKLICQKHEKNHHMDTSVVLPQECGQSS